MKTGYVLAFSKPYVSSTDDNLENFNSIENCSFASQILISVKERIFLFQFEFSLSLLKMLCYKLRKFIYILFSRRNHARACRQFCSITVFRYTMPTFQNCCFNASSSFHRKLRLPGFIIDYINCPLMVENSR